jgi:hypothetical protein
MPLTGDSVVLLTVVMTGIMVKTLVALRKAQALESHVETARTAVRTADLECCSLPVEVVK